MSRPLKDINWDVVQKYFEAGCSGIEIAAKLRIFKDTFYKRFRKQYGCSFQDYSTSHGECGKADIRYMLHAKALNNKAPGNASLLIFLARCRLGMREPEIIQTLAANQTQIDQTHFIMQLQHRIAELETNANKSKTE